MRSDKDLAASKRNRQRKTTDDAQDGGFEAHRTSVSPDEWHRCSVITRTSSLSKLSAASILVLGAACSPHAHHTDSHFQPSAVLLESVSWFVSHVPMCLDLAAENNVQAGLTGGSGYPASVTVDSGRSGAIGGSPLDFLEKRHGSASPRCQGFVDAVAA